MKCWPSFSSLSRTPSIDARFEDIPWNVLSSRLDSKAAEMAVDAVPIRDLKQAVGLLAWQIIAFSSKDQATMEHVKADFAQLLTNMAACKGLFTSTSPELTSNAVTLVDDLRDIAAKLKKFSSRGSILRYLYRRIFSRSNALVDIQHQIFRWAAWFSDMSHKAKDFDDSIDRLERAPARHDSGWRSDDAGCYGDTRVELLDEIDKWAKGEIDSTQPIFWLDGLAGTGKSSIAYTVAERCQKSQQLGASFFFSRSKSQCTDALLFFSTIAHQLASFDPRLKISIAKAIMETKRPEDASIRIQFRNFLIAPLEESFGSRQAPLVVVVDALDECSSRSGITEILQLITENARRVPFLRFLITSRPETHIRDIFYTSIQPISRLFVLHDIDPEIVRRDIELFFKSKLPLLGPSAGWPTPEEVSKLVEYAAGFFIFASTAVKFLEGDKYKAQSRLDILLKKRVPRLNSPYANLDMLYLQILQDALPRNARDDLKDLFQQIVGTIVLIFDPVPLSALEKLFDLEEDDASTALSGLHSVVIVPASDSDGARAWHHSFRDFLTDDQRCIDSDGRTDPRFYINPAEHHSRIAISCLKLLTSSLKKNICDIRGFDKSNDEVDDLQQRIDENIPPHLRYSCVHWTSHVLQTNPTDLLMDLLSTFFREYFLYWLEALSLLNKLETAAKDLIGIKQWYSRKDELPSLINDAQRYTLSFYDVISKSALHVYQSALLFTPRDTALFRTYREKMETNINVAGGVEDQWSPCLRVLEHYSDVFTVASSPDGRRLVSGAGDSTVRVWDREAGTLIAELKEHSGAINSVAFSEDGAQIASGSSDGNICVWDAVTYAYTAILRGHLESVTSISFFRNSTRLVSGSKDKTIRVWLSSGQDSELVLRGHSLDVTGVACCPRSRYIASGSLENEVRIWDANTGDPVHTWRVDEEVYCVAFSPNGVHIAAGSRNHKVLIWDVENHNYIAVLDGNTHFIYSIAFSHDGSQLISGSYDSIVQVWDVQNAALVSTLRGHSDPVVSVAISHDGSVILSGSHDKSVRVWDLTATRAITNGNGHTSMINSIAFSPDGSLIVTTSDDFTALIWNHEMRNPIATLRHSNLVLDAKFFPDGSRIITGSHDQTVGIWKNEGGLRWENVKSLEGHTDSIRCISVSPSGRKIAAGSGDRTARTWDATNYTFVVELRGHLDWVTAVAFSSDDSLIVTGSNDCKVRIWEFPSGVSLKVLDGHPEDPFVDIAFRSTARTIISRTSSHKLLAWDADTRQPVPAPATDEADMVITNLTEAYSECIVVENRGWVIMKEGSVRKRVCWIPPTWRGLHSMAFHSSKLAIGSGAGQAAMLDFGV